MKCCVIDWHVVFTITFITKYLHFWKHRPYCVRTDIPKRKVTILQDKQDHGPLLHTTNSLSGRISLIKLVCPQNLVVTFIIKYRSTKWNWDGIALSDGLLSHLRHGENEIGPDCIIWPIAITLTSRWKWDRTGLHYLTDCYHTYVTVKMR